MQKKKKPAESAATQSTGNRKSVLTSHNIVNDSKLPVYLGNRKLFDVVLNGSFVEEVNSYDDKRNLEPKEIQSLLLLLQRNFYNSNLFETITTE